MSASGLMSSAAERPYRGARYALLRSSARAVPIASEVIQCVVTSPPYWGLPHFRSLKKQIS